MLFELCTQARASARVPRNFDERSRAEARDYIVSVISCRWATMNWRTFPSSPRRGVCAIKKKLR